MRNLLLVAWREFSHRVRSRGFILASLAVPVFLAIMWFVNGDMGASSSIEAGEQESLPQSAPAVIGYIDRADLIHSIPESLPQGAFVAYQSEEAATAAVESGEISAYYIIPADYRQTGDVVRVSEHLPVLASDSDFFDLLLVGNLFPDADAAQLGRLNWPLNGNSPDFVSLGSVAEEGQEEGDFSDSMLPFIVAMAVMLPLFTSGNYLLQSVTQEKSGRVMEIMLVSLRPWQMLAGKLLGLGSLTLVQYLIWVILGGAGMLATGRDLGSLLAGIRISPSELGLVVPFALGGFILYAGLMAGVGAMSPNLEGTRSWAFIITLPMLAPIYVWLPIVQSPNGALALTLSMIPFSAPMAMMMRMTSTAVPTWQLLVSLGLLLVTAIGMVWLMARLFRAHTLLSGESFSMRRLVSALRA